MFPWRRHIVRHYSRRDLKCFMGVLMVLAITVVMLLVRAQYQNSDVTAVFRMDLDDGNEDLGGDVLLKATEATWRRKVEVERAYTHPLPSPSNVTYLQAFTSPYIKEADDKDPFREFKISKSARKNSTGKKIITWYAVASERLREDLFDDDVFEECPVSKCKFVRPEILGEKPDKTVDAIIFPGIAGRDKPPLHRAHPNQVFIYYDLDPPLRPIQAFGGNEWNSVFNWTWSYRRDADIWEPAGMLRKKDKVKDINYFKNIAKDKNKNKHVAWFVSTCTVPSEREKYVKELQKYVNVDIFGQCGNKTCPKSYECLQMLTQKYFFYLSFESALCKDYVTDKFFHMFFDDIHVLPIVMGGADYKNFFAEGSYIDVNWFPSPKHLGEFLRVVMEDKKVYWELLWRKSHFGFAGSGTTSALCQLCQRLHDLPTFHKTYPDLHSWYRHQQCWAPPKL